MGEIVAGICESPTFVFRKLVQPWFRKSSVLNMATVKSMTIVVGEEAAPLRIGSQQEWCAHLFDRTTGHPWGTSHLF